MATAVVRPRVARGNITFVTMLVHNPEDPNPPIKRLEWLITLLRGRLPLVLYIDSFYQTLIPPTAATEALYPDLRIIPLDLEATEIFTHVRGVVPPPALPSRRNVAKDTVFFCTLMNTKTELVARACRDGLVSTPFVAFLDASIVKVLGETTRTLQDLRDTCLDKGRVREVLFPGCFAPRPWEPLDREAILERICWMFCGGFFVLPRERAMEWHVRCRDALLGFLREGRITWEVNVWAWMVERDPALAQWFAADHNDSMLRIPDEFREARVADETEFWV